MLPLGLPEMLADVDLLYLHEGWTLSNLWASRVARRLGVPYVLMPHGVYEAEIVKTLKSVPLRRRAEALMVERAAAVHTFLPGESVHVSDLCPGARIVTIPTGFDAPGISWMPGGQGYLGWVGRFDIYHKGIDLLLEALAAIDPEDRPRIRMVGPDYDGGIARAKDLISRHGLDTYVSIEGAKYGDDLALFVAESRGFIHTPRWECLGRTVVDAMLLGVPTLVTRSAQLGMVSSEYGVALTPSLERDPLSKALSLLWQQPEAAKPEATRLWAQSYFSWTSSVGAWTTIFGS
jgi:glycosyltransferase involved in cell wall biosynthesis